MGATTKSSQQIKDLNSDNTVEVLYQKMGDRWFAFSLVGDDVFVGSITQEEIDTLEAGESKQECATPSEQAQYAGAPVRVRGTEPAA